MKISAMLLGLQAALAASRAMAVSPGHREIQVTSDQGHRVVKRIASSDANWCVGKVHASEGDFKPESAVCNWALDRSYSVYCVQQGVRNPKAYWIQAFCDPGFLCQQHEEARLWNGLKGFDVECRPSKTLVKWAIGTRETGHAQSKYCSPKIQYTTKGGRTAVWEFFAQYFGITGQATQINDAEILWNGKSIQEQIDVNHVGTRHTLKSGDLIQYCGTRGSDALIEGYATAKVVSFLNEAGQEVQPDEHPEVTATIVD
ncbi:hypothetical protein B0J12DRAFT_326293 [Macrophomina phaseolina]|uniref:Uncharacterized protein n=1 Tax=Macrophomina phaseolina TaxID=35725 RepID=A0ABQ8FV62_9PEZI|nr:hypothetical protein B0J12DRAFT_326293 [Macrophomina phaseolina]